MLNPKIAKRMMMMIHVVHDIPKAPDDEDDDEVAIGAMGALFIFKMPSMAVFGFSMVLIYLCLAFFFLIYSLKKKDALVRQ